MNTSHSTTENRIASYKIVHQYISGPHWEPPTLTNATTYWRCTSCHRESIREQDLYRKSFYAPACEVHR